MKELFRPSVIAAFAALLFLFPAAAETNQPDKGLYVEQCRLMPDVIVYAEPQSANWTPHLTLTNAGPGSADVTVTFFDARWGGEETFRYELAGRRKFKVNLQAGPEHETILKGGTRPDEERWFRDGYLEIRSSGGGDVRAVLELVRSESVPTREYGQSCSGPQ